MSKNVLIDRNCSILPLSPTTIEGGNDDNVDNDENGLNEGVADKWLIKDDDDTNGNDA